MGKEGVAAWNGLGTTKVLDVGTAGLLYLIFSLHRGRLLLGKYVGGQRTHFQGKVD